MRCLAYVLIGLALVALGVLAFYYFVDVVRNGAPEASVQGGGQTEQSDNDNEAEAELSQPRASAAPVQPPLTGAFLSPTAIGVLSVVVVVFAGSGWLWWRSHKEL